jgi:class 3 adenylate cyclase
MVLAASRPDQFPTLVLVNSSARLRRADDYPIGAPPHVVDRFAELFKVQHGTTGDVLLFTAPSVADDQRFRQWFIRFQRSAQKQRIASQAIDWIAGTDVRAILPSIQADTLVIHRRDAIYHRLDYGKYLAENIPGAEFRIVEGADTIPFHAGDFGPTLDEVEEFLTGERTSVDSNRMLATVLFTDIVGSTSLASQMGDDRWLDLRSEHDRIVHANLERHRGTAVKMTGDGALATFDGPQRGVLCALSMKNELDTIGLPIRAGLHTGEVEVRDGELGGIAVHIASRVMDAAESGGVMVSSTVKDLVFGSPLLFDSCGEFELKGVPGSWDLFEAQARSN